MKKIIILAASAVVLCACSRTAAPEVAIIEYLYTDVDDGLVYRSSEFLDGVDRIGISETIYFEDGLYWINGKKEAENFHKELEQALAECNVEFEGCGELSCRYYTPSWDTDAGTKGAIAPCNVGTYRVPITVEELTTLRNLVLETCGKYQAEQAKDFERILINPIDHFLKEVKAKPGSIERDHVASLLMAGLRSYTYSARRKIEAPIETIDALCSDLTNAIKSTLRK